MRHIQGIIREVDDQPPAADKDRATFNLPAIDLATMPPHTVLDHLEATTHEIGTAILPRMLQAQWELVDAELAEQYRQRFPPSAPQCRRTCRRTGR
ncbi:MAG: hypothetical protein MI924_17375 [Chloroflexales bacterium]|nr:hypothetical protein [Chloroflexales bacterium]